MMYAPLSTALVIIFFILLKHQTTHPLTLVLSRMLRDIQFYFCNCATLYCMSLLCGMAFVCSLLCHLPTACPLWPSIRQSAQEARLPRRSPLPPPPPSEHP